MNCQHCESERIADTDKDSLLSLLKKTGHALPDHEISDHLCLRYVHATGSVARTEMEIRGPSSWYSNTRSRDRNS
jgi:hypothetical protein